RRRRERWRQGADRRGGLRGRQHPHLRVRSGDRDRGREVPARRRPCAAEHGPDRLERGRRLVPERREGCRSGRPCAWARRGPSPREHPELRLPEAPTGSRVAQRRGVERRGEPQAARRARSTNLTVATVVEMTTFNLRTLKLRSGEQFRDEQETKLEPLELGGQRYLPVPETVPAELTITRASTGTVFELGFHVRTHVPCFRCLEDAVLDLPISAREYQATAPDGDEELRTPYLDNDRLDLSAWAHDA